MLIEIEDEELHQIREVFKMFDKDGSLSIEISELGNIYRALGRKFKDDELKEMVYEVDLNKDGHISFHEFLNLYKKKVLFNTYEEKLRQAFEICDKDDSGYITLDELKRIMSEVGENLNEKQIRLMLKEADLDGDNRINFEEFIQLMKNQLK
ncbi:MAG: EF-hand domain-containing protein [Candidatus Hermodarchaeota archaeon]